MAYHGMDWNDLNGKACIELCVVVNNEKEQKIQKSGGFLGDVVSLQPAEGKKLRTCCAFGKLSFQPSRSDLA
jgi:hypothetical protein